MSLHPLPSLAAAVGDTGAHGSDLEPGSADGVTVSAKSACDREVPSVGLPRVVFESGGAFLADLQARVDRRLADGTALRRARLRLYAKGVAAVALLVGPWATLIFAAPGLALCVVSLAAISLGLTIVAFSVQHDANHSAYFTRRRYNHLLGWSADCVMGISSYAWRVKHNVAHHTYTNVAGYDHDLEQAPFAIFSPSDAPKPWYRWQHVYIWPLYGLMSIRWQVAGDAVAFLRGRIGESRLRMPRGWDLAGLVGGRLVFLAWAVVAPLLIYPWWMVALGYGAVTFVIGFTMALTFQLAHCVEEASFVSAEELAESERRLWAVHEIETTVDFCQRNRALTWLLGGLNFQIEHHLYPRLPHTLYPALAEDVRATCAEHGVRYTAQPNLWRAIRSHVVHIYRMGQQGQKAAIEMG